MIKNKVKIFIILLCLVNVRCSDFEKQEPDKPNNDILLPRNEQFSVEIVGGDKPNKFFARLNIVLDKSAKFVVHKKYPDQRDLQIEQSELREGAIVDEDVVAGGKYEYSLSRIVDSSVQLLETLEVEVPKDFVLSDLANYESKEIIEVKAFRLFLSRDSVLYTRGKNINIEVQEIISDGGMIRTFSSSEAADIGQSGKLSGSVSIKAQKITGPLKIEIRGQNGGQGFKGRKGEQGFEGLPSPETQVSAGFFSELWGTALCNRQYYESFKAQKCGDLSYEECRFKFHPGVGRPGGPGGKGYQGLKGARGGSVADAYINLPESKDLEIIYEPGAGGRGGIGGDGGSGGLGGLGAPLIENSKNCEDSPRGRPGTDGPAGDAGAGGESGTKGILYLAKESR